MAGPLNRYFSLDQFPKSVTRQRSLQNGNSLSFSELVGFLQIGQRVSISVYGLEFTRVSEKVARALRPAHSLRLQK